MITKLGTSLAILGALIATCALPVVGTQDYEGEYYSGSSAPSWSPSGQKIAFHSGHLSDHLNIWLINADGTGLQRITDTQTDDINPGWSPDSFTLYFVSERSGKLELWRKDLSSGDEARVSRFPARDFAVSPEGTEIIIQTGVIGGIDLAIISSSDGEFLRWLAADSNYGQLSPTWSPDGQKAAFNKHGNVWLRNTADRTNLHGITNFTEHERIFGTLSWGTGGYIAFDMTFKLYKVKPDGTDLTCIFEEAEAQASSPDWSPDGNKLVFAKSWLADGQIWYQELFTINADGTGLTQLTHTVARPTFEPEGGEYGESQTVTISSATPGATIRYTTDGSDPIESSPEYTEPVTIGQNTILNARAWKTDYFPSMITTAAYVLQVDTPEFYPDGGTHTGTQSIIIACSTSDAVIRYTTDGTDPTETSTEYAYVPVQVTTSLTLKAKAFKTGLADSEIAVAEYVIE